MTTDSVHERTRPGVRVLVVTARDALAEAVLARLDAAFDVTSERIASLDLLAAAVASADWDVVICDPGSAGANCRSARHLADRHGEPLRVLAVSLEENEVQESELLRAGVRAALGPGRFHHLVPLVERELADATSGIARALGSIVRYSPDPVLVVDSDGRIQKASALALSLLGYAEEELAGRLVEELLPERYRASHAAHRARFMERPAFRPMGAGMEFPAIARDGSQIPVEISLAPIQLGGRTLVICALRDLRARLSRVQPLLAFSPDPMLIIGTNGHILHANGLLLDLVGYREQDLVGKPVEQLVPESLRSRHRAHRAAYMAAPDARSMGVGRDFSLLTRDGRVVPVEISLAPLHADSDHLIVCAIRDLTDRRRAERLTRAIMESTASTTGHAFMLTLVKTLAQALEVQAAFVGEFVGPAVDRAQVLAMWTGGDYAVPFEYLLAGTPCALVSESGECLVADHVRDRFPEDEALGHMGAESYFGTRIMAPTGEQVGLLAILHTGPLVDTASARHVLRLFATRAGAEIGRQRAERALRLRDRALDASVNGVLIARNDSPGFPIVYVNPAFERLTGYPAAEALGRDPGFLGRGDRDQPALRELQSAIAQGRESTTLLRNYRKDGTPFWSEMHVAPVREADDSVSHYVGIFNDVSDRVRYQEELEHQANHDTLSGLPNRNLLRDRLDQAIAHAERAERTAAVVFCDIDHFKRINDSLGHALGDQVIVAQAARLALVLRSGDTVARMGGDEFVLVLANLNAELEAARIAEKVRKALGQPLHVDGHEFVLSASVGIALYPKDGTDGATLLRNADAALYRAKEEGRDCVRFFTNDLNARVRRFVSIERELRHGIQNGELLLHYQPIFRLGTGKLIGAEALVRWRRGDGSIVPPGDFIPVAEESGLIVPLERWVTETAARQASAWNRPGGDRLVMSVNLSARRFRDSNVAGMVREAIEASGLEPSLLKFEITESAVMHDAERAVEVLGTLKGIGVQLSVDDFGTGYSSLAYLKRFPIDTLKLDRSFVSGLPDDENDLAISGAIIDLAHSLDLDVIAEGVETPAQAETLRRLGCENAQGYLLGRPVEPAAFGLETPRKAGNRRR